MKHKLVVIAILIFVVVSIFIVYPRWVNNITFRHLNSLSPDIELLIHDALDVQYGKSNVKLSEVYTEEFISSKDFSKTNHKIYAPYILFREQHMNVVYTETGDFYSITIHIEDKAGSYFQVIYFEKIDNKYYIKNIEHDI